MEKIRETGLFRRKAPTFERYCLRIFKIGRAHAKRIILAAQIYRALALAPIGAILPERETQVRPLAGLAPEAMRKVWDRAVELAKRGRLTAKIVGQAVAELCPRPAKTSPAVLIARKMLKLAAELRKNVRTESWPDAKRQAAVQAENLYRWVATQPESPNL